MNAATVCVDEANAVQSARFGKKSGCPACALLHVAVRRRSQCIRRDGSVGEICIFSAIDLFEERIDVRIAVFRDRIELLSNIGYLRRFVKPRFDFGKKPRKCRNDKAGKYDGCR